MPYWDSPQVTDPCEVVHFQASPAEFNTMKDLFIAFDECMFKKCCKKYKKKGKKRCKNCPNG